MIRIGHRTFVEMHNRIKRVPNDRAGFYGWPYDDSDDRRPIIRDRRANNTVSLVRPLEEIESLTKRPKPKRLCKKQQTKRDNPHNWREERHRDLCYHCQREYEMRLRWVRLQKVA